STGRESPGRSNGLSQPDDHDADRRTLARRELDVRRVGGLPRNSAEHEQGFQFRLGVYPPSRPEDDHLPARAGWLGALPLHRFHNGNGAARQDVLVRIIARTDGPSRTLSAAAGGFRVGPFWKEHV